MTTILYIFGWSVFAVLALTGVALALDVPLDTVVSVAFIAEIATMLGYGGICLLRWSSRSHQPRHEYRRTWHHDPAMDPTIRVIGEVVDDDDTPRTLPQPQARRQLDVPQRLALPAPKE